MTEEEIRRAEELLPFAVNGTLSEAEKAEVEAAVAADERLAAELAFLRGLREEVRGREVANSPGEFGLARLRRSIAAEAPAEAAPAEAPSSVTPLRAPRTNAWWKVAAVAASALLVVQTAVVILKPPAEEGYETVTLAGGGPPQALAGTVITIAFRPDAPEGEVRALLLDAGVVIIDGPSAIGFYRVAPIDADGADQAEELLRGSDLIETLNRE